MYDALSMLSAKICITRILVFSERRTKRFLVKPNVGPTKLKADKVSLADAD